MRPSDRILTYKPSRVLDKNEERDCDSLCDALIAFSRNMWLTFIDNHANSILVEVYCSDGTEHKTFKSFSGKSGDLQQLRHGASTDDWLVERRFCISADGDAAVLCCEPRVMVNKTAWTHYAAYESEPMVRERHVGWTISHHCWDGAVRQAMERHARQRHLAYDAYLLDAHNENTAFDIIMRSLFTCVTCCIHHCHNGLKWAVSSFSCKDTQRQMWIVMESLRNSFSSLILYLHPWLLANTLFEDFDGEPTLLYEFWAIVGLSHEWRIQLTEARLRFEDGYLKIGKHMEGTYWTAAVTTLLLHIWSFDAWSTSRWCRAGACCRSLVGCLFTGLKTYVAHVLKNTAASTYYLRGFNNLTPAVERMAVTIAASSRVSEKALEHMLKDDRLALSMPFVETALTQEMNITFDLSDDVIALLASICSRPGHEVRAELNSAAMIQHGYIRHRLRELDGYPWSLCRGDIPANMQVLANMSQEFVPVDGATEKLYFWANNGVMAEAVEVVRALSVSPCSSRCVEQGHSAHTSVVKQHKKIGTRQLSGRAYLQQYKVLFERCKLRTRSKRLRIQLNKIGKRRPYAITARQAFCGALVDKAMVLKSQGRVLPHRFKNQIFKRHAAQFRRLGTGELLQLEGRAEELRDRAEETNRRDASNIQSTIQEVDEKLDMERVRPKQLALSRCRFSDEVIETFNNFCDARSSSGAELEARRQAAVTPVTEPPEMMRALLDSMPTPAPLPRSDVWEDWIAVIARRREDLSNSILKMKMYGETRFFFLVYAMAHPLLLCLAECMQREDPARWLSADTFHTYELDTWTYNFSSDFTVYSFSDTQCFIDASDVEILLDVDISRPRYLRSDAEWFPLSTLLTWPLDEQPRAKASSSHARCAAATELDPYLAEAFMWEHTLNAPLDPRPHAGATEPTSATLDALQELWDAGEKVPVRAGDADGMRPFYIICIDIPLHGAHGGLLTPVYKAQGRVGAPKLFCQTFKLHVSFNARPDKLGGVEVSLALAQYWVTKMEFLFNLWIADGGRDDLCDVDWAAELASNFVEPANIQGVYDANGASVRLRVVQIRQMVPLRL